MESVALTLLGLLGLLFLGLGVHGCARSIRARRWPRVIGHVSTAGYDTIRRTDARSTEYLPWIEYQYRFGGRTYRAPRCYVAHPTPFLREDAIRHVESRPAGSEMAVWVNPHDASQSATTGGIDWPRLVPIALGAALVFFSALMLRRR